jgi:thioredoxin-dependent peroxiredoxin
VQWQDLTPEFVRRDVKVIGLSVDPLEDNYVWVGDIAETQGYALHFPMIADADRQIAELYGMIHPNADDTLTVHSVFIISPNKTLRPLAIRAPAKRELQARNGLENF